VTEVAAERGVHGDAARGQGSLNHVGCERGAAAAAAAGAGALFDRGEIVVAVVHGLDDLRLADVQAGTDGRGVGQAVGAEAATAFGVACDQ